MKIIMISVFAHHISAQPIRLAQSYDLSSFSMFFRGSMIEHLNFLTRTVVQQTPIGIRQSVSVDDSNPFVVHVYVRADGLSGVCVADKEYPPRVAFSLINRIITEYEDALAPHDNWKAFSRDQTLEPVEMKQHLREYQDPAQADKLTKVSQDLEEIKGIMQKNIEDILDRGTNLDDLMQKSSDLSTHSLHFYEKAKKTNACCKY